MAVDTRNKRASMMSLGRPWVPRLPLPDGGFTTAGDRAQLEFRYRGIVEPDEGGEGGDGGVGTAGGGIYRQIHHRSGRKWVAAQSSVPQLYMKIG